MDENGVKHLDGCLRLQGWGTCDCGEDDPRFPPAEETR